MSHDGRRTEGLTRNDGAERAEAAARLKAEGFNELPRAGHRSIARLIVDVLREPMLLSLGLLEISKFPLRQALKRNQRVASAK